MNLSPNVGLQYISYANRCLLYVDYVPGRGENKGHAHLPTGTGTLYPTFCPVVPLLQMSKKNLNGRKTTTLTYALGTLME